MKIGRYYSSGNEAEGDDGVTEPLAVESSIVGARG